MSVMTPKSLSTGLQKGLDELRRHTSSPIRGFRAPFFSLSPETHWFLDIIAHMGFVYDSSLFPHSGRPKIFGGTLGIFQLPNGLYEVPLTMLIIGAENPNLWRRIRALSPLLVHENGIIPATTLSPPGCILYASL